LSIVIPIFNEARVIRSTIEELSSRFPTEATEFILVDDGSHDDSAGLAEHLTISDPRFSLVRLPHNIGKGAAIRAGVARATGSEVIFMDADLSSSLVDVEVLLGYLSTYDIVIGSRSVPGSVVKRSNALRTLMGRIFNQIMRVATGLDVHDSQCGFKAFRGDVARLLFAISEENRYAFDPEILSLGVALGYSIKEVPVTWVAGENSAVRPIRDSLRTGLDLIPIRVRTRSSRISVRASRSGLTVPEPLNRPTDH
jgi:glycosyltransferase involved in cell wall biosynthesis